MNLEFDKSLFFDYLKTEKAVNNNVSHLYRMYKIYYITDEIINRYGNEGVKIITQEENNIYRIDNKCLNDKERVEYEINKIKLILEKQDVVNKKIYKEFCDLETYYQETNKVEMLDLFYLKKQISILQSKLGLKNTFFLATHDVFFEIYRNIYLRNDIQNQKK